MLQFGTNLSTRTASLLTQGNLLSSSMIVTGTVEEPSMVGLSGDGSISNLSSNPSSLFSTILLSMIATGAHWRVCPGEKVRIAVPAPKSSPSKAEQIIM